MSISALVAALTFFRLVEGYVEVEAVDAWALLAVASVVTACALRHRSREAFLAVSFLANLAYTFDLPPGYPGLGLIVSLPFAAYGVAAHRSTGRAVGMAAVVAVGLVTTATTVRGVTLLNVFPLTVLSLLTCGVAFGLLAKTRWRLLESVRRAALEAQDTREALAEARVSEERLRNARNLHDVIGHRVAVINLQAEAAALSSDPGAVAAAPALRTIGSSAREILDEIGTLLGGTPDEVPQTRRRTADLPRLVTELAAGGLSIRCTLLPLTGPLADPVDTTLYLLAEEALVNAYKYASREAPVELSVEPHTDGVLLRVCNLSGSGRTSSASGLESASSRMGLAGMRERAASLGGVLTVESSADRFELQVVLPVQP